MDKGFFFHLTEFYSLKMPKLKFNHSSKLNPQLLMLMYGGSQSGKTHLLFNMLTTSYILDYNNLLIFTNTPEQSYYQLLLHGFKNKLDKPDIQALYKLYEESDDLDIENIPEMCETMAEKVQSNTDIEVTLTNDRHKINDPSELSQKKKNLVIFDDCVNDKDQTLQETFFTRGRHSNCCCIYLTQSFYGVNRNTIRKNANVFILFTMTPRDVTQLLQDIDVGSKEEFKRIASRQWEEPNNHKYLLINIFKPKKERILTSVFCNHN